MAQEARTRAGWDVVADSTAFAAKNVSTYIGSPLPTRVRSFSLGVGSTLDLTGRPPEHVLAWRRHVNDATALASDWIVVGEDFRRAAGSLNQLVAEALAAVEADQDHLFDPDRVPTE